MYKANLNKKLKISSIAFLVTENRKTARLSVAIFKYTLISKINKCKTILLESFESVGAT